MYSLLSHSWSGLLIAAALAAVAALVVHATRKSRWPRLRYIGFTLHALAALIAVGAIVAIFRIHSLENRYAPMGKLVDIGGYRMHILAEGEARGRPTVVWIPGVHAQGLLFHHLHARMRQQGRSIIFDRPGTGWSDTGPFPRRTGHEAEEMAKLLQNAGERGPFVIVGHSFGGLLAANFARRYPERTAALVLLDATPPDQVYGTFTGVDGFAGQVQVNALLGLSKLVGLQIDIYAEIGKRNADVGKMIDTIYGELRDVLPQYRANDAGPASDFAAASIFGEFAPEELRLHAMDLVVYDGELGDMPVFIVVPKNDFDEVIHQIDLDEATRQRLLRFVARTRLRYLQTSSRSELIYAPPGTTHNFPYERPELVMEIVQRALTAPDAVPDSVSAIEPTVRD
jgi:pimeloyl-ACP methyl ester carboxylesterase